MWLALQSEAGYKIKMAGDIHRPLILEVVMSETRKPYQVKNIAREIRPAALAPFEAWSAPTPGEIRAALQAAGWTGEMCGKKLGINPRTARRWLGGEVDIPYAAWSVICVEAGLGYIWSGG